MKKSIPFVIGIVWLILSCADRKSNNNDRTAIDSTARAKSVSKAEAASKEKMVPDIYFKADGTEPFWSLKISDRQVMLVVLNDTILTPHPFSVKRDSVGTHYAIETEATKMTIDMVRKNCADPMSGQESNYQVNLIYGSTKDSELTELNGCGNYIADYRLHDIWVLEKLNGKEVSNEDFTNGLPSMEINSSTNKFMGFSGCNRMNGSLVFEKETLRFENIAMTKMACKSSNTEAAFLMALQEDNRYEIGENRLKLSNAKGTSLVFKKVD